MSFTACFLFLISFRSLYHIFSIKATGKVRYGHVRIARGDRDATAATTLYSSVSKEPMISNGAKPREWTSRRIYPEKGARFVHPQVIKMYQRATNLIKQGENSVAHKLLLRCIELNRFDAHSWLALARLEAKMGHITKARQSFNDAIDVCPRNVHLLQARGHFELKYGNLAAARTSWTEALLIEPHNAHVCHALSSMEWELGNHHIARELLRETTQYRPTAALNVALAEMEAKLDNIPTAMKILQQTLHTLPTMTAEERSSVLLSLAWLLEEQGLIIESRQHLDEAMLIDAYSGRAHIAKANFELRHGNVSTAREVLRAATQLGSSSSGSGVADGGETSGDVEENSSSVSSSGKSSSSSSSSNNNNDVISSQSSSSPFSSASPSSSTPTQEQHIIQNFRSKVNNIKNNKNPATNDPFDDRFKSTLNRGPLYTMWATLELECGNIHEARRIIEEGAQLYPADHFLLQRWASLEAKHGNHTLAKQLFEKSVFLKPHAPSFVAWAHLEESEGNILLARAKIRSIRENEKEKEKLKEKEKALLLQQAQAKFDQARLLFTVGMEADPRHGPLYHAYGNLELRLGNFTAARQIFENGILQNCSDMMSIYHAYGLLELKVGNMNNARNIFQAGIELATSRRSVDAALGYLIHSLGMLEMDQRQYNAAKLVFQRGVELFPDHSQMFLGLALSHMKLGDFKLARDYFKLSVTADCRHLHAWQAWAIAEKQLGNIEASRALFKKGLKYGPDHGALWQGYAVMEVQQQNYEVARQLFAEAVKRDPTHHFSYQAWACLETRLGNLDLAKELINKGLKCAPDHPPLWTVAGLVEDRLGNLDRARRVLAEGIRRFPDHGALYKVLGEIEIRQNEVGRAREVLMAGLEHDPHYAATYHTAALLEARLGNLEKLSELHHKAKILFSRRGPSTAAFLSPAVVKKTAAAVEKEPVFLTGESEVLGNKVEDDHQAASSYKEAIFRQIEELQIAAGKQRQDLNNVVLDQTEATRRGKANNDSFVDDLSRVV